MILIYFIAGLIIGSFLGVVNYRIKTAEDIFLGRSRCPKCKTKIKWYDNIPLISFILLAGQCRNCRKRISWEYPLIELVTGCLYALVAWYYFESSSNSQIGLSYHSIVDMSFTLFILTYLIIIFFHDLDYMIIPDVVVFPAIVITLLFQSYKYLFSSYHILNINSPLASALVAAFVAAAFFYFLIWVSEGKWIGGGDVKIGFLAGLIVGWPKILFVLFLAYLFGAVVSVLLIVFKMKTWKSQIPFAPFIVTAIIVIMFLSDFVQYWTIRYLNLSL